MPAQKDALILLRRLGNLLVHSPSFTAARLSYLLDPSSSFMSSLTTGSCDWHIVFYIFSRYHLSVIDRKYNEGYVAVWMLSGEFMGNAKRMHGIYDNAPKGCRINIEPCYHLAALVYRVALARLACSCSFHEVASLGPRWPCQCSTLTTPGKVPKMKVAVATCFLGDPSIPPTGLGTSTLVTNRSWTPHILQGHPPFDLPTGVDTSHGPKSGSRWPHI